MNYLARAVTLAVLASLGAAACSDGGSQTGVTIVVDGRSLSAAQLDSVRSIWIYVDGDSDPDAAVAAPRVTLVYPTVGLATGTYTAKYRPKKRIGTLSILGELHDANDVIIATSSTTVDVRSGNQVMATIMLTGTMTIPPAMDAGPDAVTDAGAGPDVAPPPGCAAAACSATVADGCCPTSCTGATDIDCASCGNGVLDPGETCDPLSTCPAACPPTGCQLFSLTNAGTCQAACMAAGLQTQCVNGDGCCPTGCSSVNDSDCAVRCGNSVVETGELCDGNCPTACPALGCQLRTLAGAAATCDAQCANGAQQTVCASGDGCCPAGCTTADDADCAVKCGNGILEAGETCDGNCPTACPAMGCQLQALTGTPATCDVKCAVGAMQTACINKDGCCPTGCNSSNDSDCVAKCGNGVIEAGETCEAAPASPLCAAITCDDRNSCTADSRAGGDSSCNVTCNHVAITVCTAGVKDGCCPNTCNANNDPDCAATCGNAIVEGPAESCDTGLPGSCPTTCPQQPACVLPDLVNPGTCKAACADQGRRQTTCVMATKDSCCPAGCNANNDADCTPKCGNGVMEAGELCETMAPATTLCATVSCDDRMACTTDAKIGAAATCNVSCTHTAITACLATSDGCCPSGCNANNDPDCAATCGNGVKEAGETCETKGPATPLCSTINCNDGKVCTIDTSTGTAATCNLVCVNTAITACSRTSDGCCPPGCNAVTDVDCAAVCNNGVLEPGEACDVAPASPTCASISPTSCADTDACTTDSTTGSAATCTLKCAHTTIATCKDGDGCCPSGCTGATDNDCAPPNDTCATATDITAGGDFSFSLTKAKLDLGTATNLKCFNGGGMPEVFFKFNLPGVVAGAPTLYYGYFDVFDPAGNAVNVALELYQGTCPVDPGGPNDCASATSGVQACNPNGAGAAWPRMTPANNLTSGVNYILVARQSGALLGRYTLRFHRVPNVCAAAGVLVTDGTKKVVSTCATAAPSPDYYDLAHYCGTMPMTPPTIAGELNYFLYKCPNKTLSVDTCDGRTGTGDTVLQINEGSVDFNQASARCIVMSTTGQICNNDNAGCTNSAKNATISNADAADRGLFTVNVGSIGQCSNIGLTGTVP